MKVIQMNPEFILIIFHQTTWGRMLLHQLMTGENAIQLLFCSFLFSIREIIFKSGRID